MIFKKKKKNKIIAYKTHPSSTDWLLEPASPQRDWMKETDNFAYRCLPLAMANSIGWIVKNPCDFTVLWNGGNNKSDCIVELSDSRFESQIHSHFGWGVITFQIPYLFKTNKETSLLVRGCSNFWIDNAQALEGYVETFWSPYTFTMNWKIIKSNKITKFNKGDPICMITPYNTELLKDYEATILDMEENPKLHKTHTEWGKYRSAFNQDKSRTKDDWQKDYLKGKKCPFSNKEYDIEKRHKTKISLPFFKKLNGNNGC